MLVIRGENMKKFLYILKFLIAIISMVLIALFIFKLQEQVKFHNSMLNFWKEMGLDGYIVESNKNILFYAIILIVATIQLSAIVALIVYHYVKTKQEVRI